MPKMSAECLTKQQVDDAEVKVLTILLLGKTGVGKSTFINALANYLLHDEMEMASKNLTCLIPLQFTATDENHQMKTVSLGNKDENECEKAGESSTQSCRCYVFEFDDYKVNIIDTPGIGDVRGVEKDGINLRNLLDFISNYKEINAICVLLTPNDCRADVLFKYCVLELLTHLNKSASENIVFVYTNSRATFYRPGETGPTLKTLLEQIKNRPPNVEIKYNLENTFCFDNESFRFLVADVNGIKFSEKEREEFKNSWDRSLSESKRMMAYVNKLTPHQVQDTVSINRARQTIINLTQPLGDTAKMKTDNIKECERLQKKIFEWKGDIHDLKEDLYIPIVDLQSEKLDKPMTVCGDSRCCETINVNGTSKTHYKTICHNPCHLKLSDGNVIGNTGLLDCRAFNKYTAVGEYHWKKVSSCKWCLDADLTNTNEKGEIWAARKKRFKSDFCFNKKCGHSYKSHLHIFTKTTVINKIDRDKTKYQKITSKKEAVKAQEEQFELLEVRIKQLIKEQTIISKCTGRFAHFLKNNAITPINDAYEEYLKHLIRVEEDCWKDNSDRTVESLKRMLENHELEKQILQEAMEQSGRGRKKIDKITKEEIDKLLKKLFKLRISGPIIKKYLEVQEKSIYSAHSEINEVKFDAVVSGSKAFGGLINKFKRWLNLA